MGEVLTIDNTAVREQQVAKIKAIKKTRNTEDTNAKLAHLTAIAKGEAEGNLLGAAVDAATTERSTEHSLVPIKTSLATARRLPIPSRKQKRLRLRKADDLESWSRKWARMVTIAVPKLSLQTPVLNDDAGASDDLSGLSLLVDLAKSGP